MRNFVDVLRFELRLHFTSPLLWALTFLFVLLNFFTQTRTGINLGDNERIALNGSWLVFQTQTVLGVFGMVACILFAVMAQTRDYERNTVEFFFSTPVSPASFVLGRYIAATSAALFVSVVGLLGALVSTFMPWLDPARLLPFDWRPWTLTLFAMMLPNTLVFCSLFFGVATLTRSATMTVCAALLVLVYGVVLNNNGGGPLPASTLHLLADPFGAWPLAEASRFWSLSELNTLLPTQHLLPNRLLWLAAGAAVLLLTVWRFRMELVPAPLERFRRKPAAAARLPPATSHTAAIPRFDAASHWLQLRAQLQMDSRGIWQSPLFWILLLSAALSIWSEATNLLSPLMDLPNYPLTALLLDFFRYSLIQTMLLAIIYYAAVLVQRERDCNVAGIAGALPYADWVPVVSKTLVLCGVILLLFVTAMLTGLAVQELSGFHEHYLSVFLQGIFLYNGFEFWMLCVLAIVVQVSGPGKWSGMLLTLAVFIATFMLPFFGAEHLLLQFSIPAVRYSDLNGFGHFKVQTYALAVYWGAFCLLLLVVAHLLFVRGAPLSWRERLRLLRSRLSVAVACTSIGAMVMFIAAGGFIFYNTNVLNHYRTSDQVFAAQVQYELDYSRFRDADSPSATDLDYRFDLYPSERRWVSSGSGDLRNNKQQPISEFLLTVDKRNTIDHIQVEGASLQRDATLPWVFIVTPDAPLQPGSALRLNWSMRRENPGFANTVDDNDIVFNGSYVRLGLVPTAGYCADCELQSPSERKQRGLPPLTTLPQLGDPAHLDDLIAGLDARSSFHAVISTDIDQTVVGAGHLQGSWEADGRRYFEYDHRGPVWPALAPLSGRYVVARDKWNDIDLEIFYDAKHPWNIGPMMKSAKAGLAYYTRAFAPYPHTYFRMAEYARYSTRVQAGIGSIAYAEGAGFTTDLRGRVDFDYATLHELAHQWWGNDVYGAYMQGRQVLNEGLAQYSTFMVLKEMGEIQFLREVLIGNNAGYLQGRKGDPVGENPIIKSDDQPHIAYGKASQALFLLQELIGGDKVNQALRSYHDRFVAMTPPLPTTLDLVHELREVAGPDYQQLITDLFEKIMLYDTGIDAVSVAQQGNEYEVILDVSAFQYESDSVGNEAAVPLDAWFPIVVFPDSEAELSARTPLYQQFHRLHSGQQQLEIRVPAKPGAVAVDPWHLMVDRRVENNIQQLGRQL